MPKGLVEQNRCGSRLCVRYENRNLLSDFSAVFWKVMTMAEKEDIAIEALLEFLNACDAGIAATKQRIKESKGISRPEKTAEPMAAVKEETFTILKFEPQQGTRIGEYEVAYRGQNRREVGFSLQHSAPKQRCDRQPLPWRSLWTRLLAIR